METEVTEQAITHQSLVPLNYEGATALPHDQDQEQPFNKSRRIASF